MAVSTFLKKKEGNPVLLDILGKELDCIGWGYLPEQGRDFSRICPKEISGMLVHGRDLGRDSIVLHFS